MPVGVVPVIVSPEKYGLYLSSARAPIIKKIPDEPVLRYNNVSIVNPLL